jgi:NTP pyrophosphatase (non-canonical NTP hydrolase)
MIINMGNNVAEFLEAMEANFPGIYDKHPLQPAACLAEEAGEAVGAIRRAMGLARRPGSWRDAEDELADVVISSFVAAGVYDLDLESAIKRKWQKILTRGYKDPR